MFFIQHHFTNVHGLLRIGVLTQLNSFNDAVGAGIEQRNGAFHCIAQIQNMIFLIQRNRESAAFRFDAFVNLQRVSGQLKDQTVCFALIKRGSRSRIQRFRKRRDPAAATENPFP